MLPSSYDPKEPQHFIGPARDAALLIRKLVQHAMPDMEPIRLILSGPPGIGKSKLASFFAKECGSTKWTLTKFNGTQVKIEELEQIATSLHYRNTFPGYRVIQIEEIDKMPSVAASRMLTFCDDMPSGVALVATTNIAPDAMKARYPATQRRYTWLEIGPPTVDEMVGLLQSNWPAIREQDARNIAVFSCGSVGLCLQEANLYAMS